MRPGRIRTALSTEPDTVWQKEFEEMFPFGGDGRSADGH